MNKVAVFVVVALSATIVVAALLLGGGRSNPTPMQDETACAAGDHAACERRLERMRVSCDAKEVKACSALAEAHYTPLHAAKDDVLAAQYFDRSCQLDSPRGCHMLAVLKASGRVGPRDMPAVQKLEERACTLGEPSACLKLAKCIETGDRFYGCAEKDSKRARQLYARACELSDTTGCEEVQRLNRLGL